MTNTPKKNLPPRTEQGCYDLGYGNPARSSRDFAWAHLVDVNAYRSGQLDRQNLQPRNPRYDRQDYDPDTFERNPPPILACPNGNRGRRVPR